MSQNPYATPKTTATISPDSYPDKKYFYKPLRTVAIVITWMMAAMIACYLLLSVLQTAGSLMFESFNDPNADIADNEVAILFGVMIVGLLSLVPYFSLVVTVCIFMYRANANLRSLEVPGIRNTPGWCAGWWFIPIMNLFKPYQCMKEIYLASEEPGARWDWVNAPAVGWVSAWWGCWLISLFVSRIETRLSLQGIDPGPMALPLTWTATLLMVTAGILLLRIVWRITKWQDAIKTKNFKEA